MRQILASLVLSFLFAANATADFYANRTRETSTTTGTGSYTVAGTVIGYQTLANGVGDGNTCCYVTSMGSDWEVGIGTFTAPSTLSRDIILSSSNAGAAVDWGAGTKYVTVTYPAQMGLSGFVVTSDSNVLPSDRVLTGTANQITVTDGGAGSTVTLSTPQDIHTSATPTFAALTISGTTTLNSIAYTWPGADGTAGYALTTNGSGTLSWAAAGVNDASYVVLGADGTLTNERILTGTANEITVTDGGAGSNVTLSLPSSVNLGDASYLATDEVRAYDSAGLKLYEDGGKGIFVQDSTGFVGIGTTGQVTPLHIASSTNARLLIQNTAGSTGNCHLQFKTATLIGDTYIKGALIWEDDDTYANARGRFHIAVNDQSGSDNADVDDARITVGPDGNVGLSDPTPDGRLDIDFTDGSDAVVFSHPATDIIDMTFVESTANVLAVRYDGSGVVNTIKIYNKVSSTPLVTFLASGNVGIGTTAPDKSLEINAATGGTLRLTYNDSNGSATDHADFATDANGGLTVTTTDGDGTSGDISLSPDGNIKLANLTSNGFVKTSGGTGLLSVDTTTYLSAETNNLETVATGIAADEVPVGSAANVATYTGTTGTGNVVRATSPTIATPVLSGDSNSTGQIWQGTKMTTTSKPVLLGFDGQLSDYNSVVKASIQSGSSDNARGLYVFDQRATDHQPSIAVANPAGSDIFGMKWNSTGTTAIFDTLSGSISLSPVGDLNLSPTSKNVVVTSGDLKLTDGAVAAAPETVATLGVGATTFAVDSNLCVITGDGGGNTVATITGGVTGQILVLLFTDANVTITDTDVHTANTVDLSAAFTSADDTTLTLVFDGTSWYETSRSAN